MKVNIVPDYTQEQQKMLYLYFDTVLIDFDSVAEIKKIKEQFTRKAKKPGNK